MLLCDEGISGCINGVWLWFSQGIRTIFNKYFVRCFCMICSPEKRFQKSLTHLLHSVLSSAQIYLAPWESATL